MLDNQYKILWQGRRPIVNIHLYAIRLDRPLHEDEVAALMRILPPERRERLSQLSRPELGHEPLCAYAALQAALYDLYGWRTLPEMSYNRYGKPEFPAYPEVCFNLSHTRGAVLVGVHDHPLGVDIEKVRPVSERTMRRIAGVMTEREFFEGWVRRESRSKWSGAGLAAIREADAPAMRGEQFWFPQVFDGYVACVCTHTDDALEPVRRFSLQ